MHRNFLKNAKEKIINSYNFAEIPCEIKQTWIETGKEGERGKEGEYKKIILYLIINRYKRT